MARQTLLIDADDTLWENNIFFEKSIAHFISQLEHLGYTSEYVRHILNERSAATFASTVMASKASTVRSKKPT